MTEVAKTWGKVCQTTPKCATYYFGVNVSNFLGKLENKIFREVLSRELIERSLLPINFFLTLHPIGLLVVILLKLELWRKFLPNRKWHETGRF